MFDQVLLQLLDYQYAECIALGFELQNLHWEISELEVVINCLALLLSCFPSVDKAYVKKGVPEKTIKKRSLSLSTKSKRYNPSTLSDIPILLSSRNVEVLAKVSSMATSK